MKIIDSRYGTKFGLKYQTNDWERDLKYRIEFDKDIFGNEDENESRRNKRLDLIVENLSGIV